MMFAIVFQLPQTTLVSHSISEVQSVNFLSSLHYLMLQNMIVKNKVAVEDVNNLVQMAESKMVLMVESRMTVPQHRQPQVHLYRHPLDYFSQLQVRLF
jgi:hypothetical protein